MRDMPGVAAPDGVPERLVGAAIGLFAEQGPSAIKARGASATGLSTMVVYRHFGRSLSSPVPSWTRDSRTRRGVSRLPVTDDPIAISPFRG